MRNNKDLAQRETLRRLSDTGKRVADLETKEYVNANTAVLLTGTQTVAGNKTLTGQTVATNASFPPMRVERTTASTNTIFTAFDLRLTTSGNMLDNFGPVFSLSIQDDAGVSNQIAAIGAVREGADNSGKIRIYTHAAGVLTERMNINNAGLVAALYDMTIAGSLAIGPTAAAGKLHVDQSSTTAAIPVLVLDQGDVSEPIIKFDTTIGTGNAVEVVGAKTLTVTHFIKVELPGGLIRYIEAGTIA